MTPCPATFRSHTGETVRCHYRAGHQHELGAPADQETHYGRRRDGATVTWLSD